MSKAYLIAELTNFCWRICICSGRENVLSKSYDWNLFEKKVYSDNAEAFALQRSGQRRSLKGSLFSPAIWSHDNQLSFNGEGLAVVHTGWPRNVCWKWAPQSFSSRRTSVDLTRIWCLHVQYSSARCTF